MKLIQQIHEYLRMRGLLDADTEGKLRATGLLGPVVRFCLEDEFYNGILPHEYPPMQSELRDHENLVGKLEEALEAVATGARTGAKRSGGKGGNKGGSRGDSRRHAAVVEVDEVKLARRIRAALAAPATQAELAPLVWLAGGRADRMGLPVAVKVIAGSDPQALARRLALGFGKRLGLDKAWRTFGYRPAFLGGFPRGTGGPAAASWQLILNGEDVRALPRHAWMLDTPAIATVFHLIQAQKRLRRACGWVYAGHPMELAQAFRLATDAFAKETFLVYHQARLRAGTAMASRKEIACFRVPSGGRGAQVVASEALSWGWAETAYQESRRNRAINAACCFGSEVLAYYGQTSKNVPVTCPIEWIHK